MRSLLSLLRTGNRLPIEGGKFRVVATLAVPLMALELWYAAAGQLGQLQLAIFFLVPMYVISFLVFSAGPSSYRTTAMDYGLATASMLGGAYLIYRSGEYQDWISGISYFNTADFGVALLYLVLTLELMRRCVGMGISVVVWLAIAYALLGRVIPGFFGHGGMEPSRFLEEMIVSSNGGLFSAPVLVAATYAFMFISFGKFLEKSGAGTFFFNVAALIAGRRRGGAGLVAITASGMFGMISGSPVSDVMTTGPTTISAMRKTGYAARYAAAVEATASTGGALLPPVMGTAVFLMVELTGIPYHQIAVAILASALLYYAAVYFQVYFASCRHGWGMLDEASMPTWRATWKLMVMFVVPMGLLVYLLFTGRTPGLAAMLALLSVVVASWLLPGAKTVTPRLFVAGCVEVCGALAPLLAAVAGAGLLLEALNFTGLGAKLADTILGVAQNNLFPALLLAMGITIVCGMGMPVIATYSLVAVMVAPALVDAGLLPMQAHLFLVFFSVASNITPPVAVAAYVAATIADENPVSVGLTACRVGMGAFLLPFAFAYNPGLLQIGSGYQIAFDIIKISVAIFLFAVASEGWFREKLGLSLRLLLGLLALIGLFPLHGGGLVAVIVGLLVLGARSWGVRKKAGLEGNSISRG